MIKNILTARLFLIPADRLLTSLCLNSPEQFAAKLNVKLPSDWPTESLEDGIPWVLDEMNDGEIGWWIWWVIVKPENDFDFPLIIGNFGFKGPPNKAGLIEVTYSIALEQQGKGYTKEAFVALISWGFQQPGVNKIWGDTSADNLGSIKIFESSGFTLQEHESDEMYRLYSKSK